MMCISAARSYTPSAYISTATDSEVVSVESMKILGFYFNTERNVKSNMTAVQKKVKCRLWALRHLKRNGFSQDDLIRVYKAMILPIAEYCSAVYHTMITLADSLELERLQMQALKNIYGWKKSYSELLEKSGLERLDVRRKEAFAKLAKKISENPRYTTWFPRRLHRRPGLRVQEKYKVYSASTERYRKSPLNTMRRELNNLQ